MSTEVGKQIKDLRKQKGVTQEALALDSETSVSYLRQIEHGKANPTIQKLQELCVVLGMELQIHFVPSQGEEKRDNSFP